LKALFLHTYILNLEKSEKSSLHKIEKEIIFSCELEERTRSPLKKDGKAWRLPYRLFIAIFFAL